MMFCKLSPRRISCWHVYRPPYFQTVEKYTLLQPCRKI